MIGQLVAGLNAAKDRAEELKDIYSAKLTALDELKAALLAKAFSGKLTGANQAVAA